LDYTELSPVDLTLACLEGSEREAWTEFIRRFNPLISAMVLRVARKWGASSPQVLDDLIQETYLKLCADRVSFLRRFDPTSPNAVYGFLKVFTANVVHDHFRALRTKKRGAEITTELTAELESVVESKSSVSNQRSMELTVLFGEIDTFLRNTETGPTGERDRRIFWLYYRVGLTSAAIADTAGICLNTKGVESTILRLTRRVRMRMTAAATAKMGLVNIPGKGIRAADSYLEGV
jgi:RNA polymerase sigma-70 factor, ECF subfamily